MSINKLAPRNRTIQITKEDSETFDKKLITLSENVSLSTLINKTINQDIFEAIEFIPDTFIDLLFIDPPYNMNKKFGASKFKESSIADYTEWLDNLISKLDRCLTPTASIYICGDWKSSTSIHQVMEKYFIVRNRITWEREKGRGAKTNWKMNSEDIWFGTKSIKYFYNPDAVKLKRRVIAPYRTDSGKPKDWDETEDGQFRLTFPSNLWNDISVPFWSMPENTEHPTQKPEKLLAKLILASSKTGDIVFDPFLGSGTTSVVAKKLDRKFIGVEIDKDFAITTEKRLLMVDDNKTIQGYSNGLFWERNSANSQKKKTKNIDS
ncbi:MAG: DNA methyltransferase [Melioribacteraceae bacterium]|jgi:site-specific DNA-methyltransferase (adenine-specific)|nr:DNA methyltransferase [Melioribacteraceae bacterium]